MLPRLAALGLLKKSRSTPTPLPAKAAATPRRPNPAATDPRNNKGAPKGAFAAMRLVAGARSRRQEYLLRVRNPQDSRGSPHPFDPSPLGNDFQSAVVGPSPTRQIHIAWDIGNNLTP